MSSSPAGAPSADRADAALRARLTWIASHPRQLASPDWMDAARPVDVGAPSASIGTGWSGPLPGAPPPKPEVHVGVPQSQGALPAEVIRRILRQRAGSFRYCYEQVLMRDPEAHGQATVRFTITEKGEVASPTVTSDIADPSLAACLTKHLSSVRFPQPESGTVSVSYPIHFAPGEPPSGSASAAASAPPPAPGSARPPSALPAPPAASRVAAAAGSVPVIEPPVADGAEAFLPIVSVDAERITFDGKPMGTTRGASELAEAQPVLELLDGLRASGEAWLKLHPGAALAGVCGLHLGAHVPLAAVRGVFATMGLAGCSTLVMELASTPGKLHVLAAKKTGPSLTAAESKAQAPVLHVTLEKDELVLEWRRGTAGGTTTRRALSQPDLGGLFCAQSRESGVHHDMGDAARDELVLHAGDAADFDALVPVLVAIDSCSRGGPEGFVPAFLVALSTR